MAPSARTYRIGGMRRNRLKIAQVGRWIVACLIVGAVSWHFARLLRRPELWENPPSLRPEWLVGTAGGYVVAFGLWGAYWCRLLATMNQPVKPGAAVRAYFQSQLGKYVPGKALAIVLRVWLVHDSGVRPAVAAVTAVYETLTTMASGCLLAVILFPLAAEIPSQHRWMLLGLLPLATVPIFPAIFNRLARRAARPFLAPHSPPLPQFTLPDLLRGLAQTSIGWLFLGLSLRATLLGFGHDGVPWLTCVVYVAFAYVAGFLTLPLPGGLGVRDALLQQLLAASLSQSMDRPEGDALAAVVALSLRLWWTLTELTLAGMAFLSDRMIRQKVRL